MRTLRLAELVCTIGLCLLVAGCDRAPAAGAIDAIGVNKYTCRPECHDIAIWLPRNGEATIGDNAGNSESVSLGPGQFDRIANRLLQTPFFSSASDMRTSHLTENSGNVSAIFSGQFHLVFLPPDVERSSTDDAGAELARFIDDVRRETAPLKERADRAVRARLADVARLREVTYRAEGCYGTCPMYTVNLFSDGHAVLYRRKTMGAVTRAVAKIRFLHVIELLQAANFTFLQRHYPVKTVDVFGSTLRLDYDAGESFWSEARDSTQWSPTYRDLAARVDQLVLDTRWTSVPGAMTARSKRWP